MAKRAAFILPESANLSMEDGRLSIRYDGDVVIEQRVGQGFGHVHAGGNLTFRLPQVDGTITAGGTITLDGDFGGVSISGRSVVLKGKAIKAKAISATEKIVIGAAKLQVDAILAPHIDLDPNASGRVTVIQSDNERNASKIKGGFSLADYEDMFGDAAGFLRDRGLDAPAVEASGDELSTAALDADVPNTGDEDDEVVELAPTAPSTTRDEEDIDDPLSLSLDDIEPIADDEEPDVAAKLADALDRITSCYEGADTPPAVNELKELVEEGDMKVLGNNITAVWNGLIGFHQKRGIRPHHQVTHAFNVIHSLVSVA